MKSLITALFIATITLCSIINFTGCSKNNTQQINMAKSQNNALCGRGVCKHMQTEQTQNKTKHQSRNLRHKKQ